LCFKNKQLINKYNPCEKDIEHLVDDEFTEEIEQFRNELGDYSRREFLDHHNVEIRDMDSFSQNPTNNLDNNTLDISNMKLNTNLVSNGISIEDLNIQVNEEIRSVISE
jgi:hypothetical protein